jgi:hypothetical protein
MGERSSKAGGPDRKDVSESVGYEVGELAQKHGISNDQASRLIRKLGPDREKLDAEAAKLTKDSVDVGFSPARGDHS